jgi:hypothetical protein
MLAFLPSGPRTTPWTRVALLGDLQSAVTPATRRASLAELRALKQALAADDSQFEMVWARNGNVDG